QLPSPPVVQDDVAANDSKGLYTPEPEPAAAPAPKAKPVEKEVDDSPKVQIPEKKQPKEKPPAPRQVAANTPSPASRQVAANTPSPAPVPDNAVPYGQGGRPAVPYGQATPGSGSSVLSIGDGAFGDRYGWYVDAMKQTISQNWLRATVNTNLR